MYDSGALIFSALKYDVKEHAKGVDGSPVIFGDLIIDAEGRTWRRES